MTKSVETKVSLGRKKRQMHSSISEDLTVEQLNVFDIPSWNSENIELKELEHTDGILFSCTNAIETSAWFMINSTALGPVKHNTR